MAYEYRYIDYRTGTFVHVRLLYKYRTEYWVPASTVRVRYEYFSPVANLQIEITVIAMVVSSSPRLLVSLAALLRLIAIDTQYRPNYEDVLSLYSS